MGDIQKPLSAVFAEILNRAERDADFGSVVETTWLRLIAGTTQHDNRPAEDRLNEDDLRHLLLQAVYIVLEAEREGAKGAA
jgi:hypothetical protein